MGIPTPFHSRTAALCSSMKWREWAGYLAVSSYETCHEREYLALRQSAGLLDISPLFKYRVRGPDAAAMLDRLVTRRMDKCSVGGVIYSCWCNDRGKVIDDGTIARLEENLFRVTSASPSFRWFRSVARGFDVVIEDESTSLAALAIQGPTSREILRQVSDADLDNLKYFRLARCRIGSIPVVLSRTGYTGDLGYEIWAGAEHAGELWDLLMDGGREFGLTPMGLQALDVARIEAGYILIGVDYTSARTAMTELQAVSPYEIGLGWTVHLGKDNFVGRTALLEEKEIGPRRKLVGLEIDWQVLVDHQERSGLPPNLPLVPWREVVPLFSGGRQAGWATSGCWSPILKRYIALGSVPPGLASAGSRLEIEFMVEYERKRVPIRVVPKPFFDPPRKRT